MEGHRELRAAHLCAGNNQPDAMGGGEVIVDGTLPVSLRAAGQVALLKGPRGPGGPHRTEFIQIATPSPTVDPMTCNNCSVHGITVRPLLPRKIQRSDRDTAGR